MSSERRNHARRVLYSPEYLDMGADNGGVVVNLSEGGLAFQAVGPVVPQSEIPLSFSLAPGYRIDVKARVVWVNSEGKLGGAVFGKLSKDSQSLIREWLAKPEVEHESEGVLIARAAEQELDERATESTLPVNPHPSAVATQIADVLSAEGVTGGNGSVLQESGVNAVAESADTLTFAPHEMASPQISARETISPKFPASALPKPNRSGSVTAEARRDVPASPRVHEQAPPPPLAEEPKRQRSSGTSYSVAPSIAAWSKSDSHSSARSAAPAFPPRNAENIFARSGSRMEYEHRRRGSGALVVFAIVIAAGAVVAYYARTHRQQIGSEITQIGNTIAGAPAVASTTATQPTRAATSNPASGSSPNGNAPLSKVKPAQTQPSVAPQPPGASHTPEQSSDQTTTALPKTQDAAQAAQTAQPGDENPSSEVSKAESPIKGHTAVNPPKSASSNASAESPLLGQAEYQRAENYLNGKGVSQDSAQAAEWFWRSLEAGNTGAAVPLADLYLAGDGVSRSCTQARILLDAAAQKNNATAIKKLAELPESCH